MTNQIYPNHVISAKLQHANAIAQRIDAMRRKRFVAAFKAAGLGDEFSACTLHNALISLADGKPWRGVNYSKARLARRIADDFSASRIVDNYYLRMVGLPPRGEA